MRRSVVFAFLCAFAPCVVAGPALRARYYSSPSPLVSLNWSTVSGAASYAIERTTSHPSWVVQATVNGQATSSWSQSGLATSTTYIYRVVPRDASGVPLGTPSNAAVVNTLAYTDNPLDGTDAIALQHMLALRTAVASIRAAAGAGTATWTNDPLTTNSSVSDEDIVDLRNHLNAAYANVGLPLPSYVDSSLINLSVQPVHLQQIRDLARTYPELAIVTSPSASEAYFSPNADGVKDTSTFTANVGFAAGAERTGFRWRVDVRNLSTSAVVRSGFGSGTPVAFVWNGKDNNGAGLPDAAYGFELVDLDSLSNVLGTASTVLDLTAPVATIASPADAYVISNVRMAGLGNVAVTGSVTDSNGIQSWILERTGNLQPVATINSGSTAVTSSTLGTLQTLSPVVVANGGYTLKLTGTDRAGNSTIDTTPVTVGHFSMSRSTSLANAAANDVVTYTAVVPFALNLRVDIWRGSVLFQTLTDGPRATGTHSIPWNVAAVADGAYRYIATVTEGASTMTWDRSTSYPAGLTPSQFQYPKCWTGTEWAKCGEMPSTFAFDPFVGQPLRIAYCVGDAQSEPEQCTGSNPALVVIKVSNTVETNDACDAGCVLSEYQPPGRQEVLWYGYAPNGTYIADQPRLTVIRKYDGIPENTTIVYGHAPRITNVVFSPTMFSPPSVPLPVGGQTYTVSVTDVVATRPVTATAVFRKLGSNGILRTIVTPAQAISGSGEITFTWNGRADDPATTMAAAGLYEVTISVADSTGSKATVKPIVLVRY